MAEFIGVVIADDHPLMRSGIRATLSGAAEIRIVGEASNGNEVQSLCRRLEPHVLILDLNMPGPSFLEVLTSLKDAAPEVNVLVLTASRRWRVRAEPRQGRHCGLYFERRSSRCTHQCGANSRARRNLVQPGGLQQTPRSQPQ